MDTGWQKYFKFTAYKWGISV